MKWLTWLRDRLDERSTWMLILSGIGTASALPRPWDIVSAIGHTIAAFVPDGTLTEEK